MSTPGMSQGIAPVSFPTAITSAAGTDRHLGVLSMKRAISHGQAMRSIFGRSRVTDLMLSLPMKGPPGFLSEPAPA